MKHNDNFDLILRGDDREPLNFFGDWFDDFMPTFSRKDMKRFNSIMKTDVKEIDKSYVLDIDLPGFDKKDVNLELENGYLTISAKRENKFEEKDDKKENFIRRERSFGQFSRSFYVGDIKEEDIDASLENGILTVTIPKEEKEMPKKKRIEIK